MLGTHECLVERSNTSNMTQYFSEQKNIGMMLDQYLETSNSIQHDPRSPNILQLVGGPVQVVRLFSPNYIFCKCNMRKI